MQDRILSLIVLKDTNSKFVDLNGQLIIIISHQEEMTILYSYGSPEWTKPLLDFLNILLQSKPLPGHLIKLPYLLQEEDQLIKLLNFGISMKWLVRKQSKQVPKFVIWYFLTLQMNLYRLMDTL